MGQDSQVNSSGKLIALALIPVVFMAVALILGVGVYGTDPHVPLLLSCVVAVIVSFIFGYSWHSIEKSIFDMLYKGIQPMLIIVAIGAFIGVWMAAGIVPSVVYYGLEIISPTWFLLTATILCIFVSMVGGAWPAAGTIGVALISIAHGLGIPLPLAAGAIISGVYFGDKMSPLSDIPNFTAAVVGIDVFEHIRNMLYTTIPALVISLLLYIIIGFQFKADSLDKSHIQSIQTAIAENFTISPWLIIPFVFIGAVFIFKIPAIPGMTVGVLVGMIIAFSVQSLSIGDVFTSMHYGLSIDSGNEVADSLLNEGGIESMEFVISLMLIALTFGAIIQKARILEILLHPLIRKIKRTGSLITSTAATCYVSNAVGCDPFMSVVIPGNLYINEYEKRGLHPKLLARTMEDCGTIMANLIPWTTGGVYMYTVLGVSPIYYAPFAFFCYLTTPVAIIFGYFNIKINRISENEHAQEATSV